VGVLFLSERTSFQPYFGSLHPLLATAIVLVSGAVSLRFLQSHGWFEIAKGQRVPGIVLSAKTATAFAIPTIFVDLVAPFPRGINVPPPESLLFYPAIAYVAEIAFHAVPLSLLLICLRPFAGTMRGDRLIWASIVVASCLEPTFHVGAQTQPLSWVDAYVAVHVFVFNLAQLYAFRRFDFVSMYSFRVVYYLCWHILWGSVRLHVLF
jgi:hypothetical protein